ncbi:MAG TPA: TonB-dependent receptor [Candidatus Competibacteraceae bacterium]|nr:TonB-dependent receptor [Candidatus Competibacteraceae bacterium]
MPGVTVAYENGSNYFVAYQGLNDGFSRRMQVLVDGRSVYNQFYGGVVWSSLPLEVDDIERIEVVRGPNASTDGSNSFLGTISITTRHSAEDRGTYARVRAGNDNIRDTYLRYGGTAEALSYRLTGSYRQDDGLETRPDDRQIRYLSGRADWNLTPTQRLMVQGGYNHSDLEQGFNTNQFSILANPFEACFPHHNRPIQEAYGQLRYEHIPSPDKQTLLQAYYSRLHTAFHYTLPPLCGGSTDRDNYTVERYDLELRNLSRLSPTARMSWGAELRWDGIDATERSSNNPASPFPNDHSNLSSRLLGHLEWKFAHPWLLNVGAMLEKDTLSDYFGVSPRAALHYFFTPTQAVRVGVAKGVRTPNFVEEDWKSDFYVSSGGLAAEKMLARELAYVSYFPSYELSLDVRLFWNRVRDLIVADPTVFPFTYVNKGHADIRGVEGQTNWKLSRDLRLNLTYAYTHIASDDPFGINFSDSNPKHIADGFLTYDFNEWWQSSVGYYYASSMEWLNDGTRVPAIHRLDARLARRLALGPATSTVALKFENILHDEVTYKNTNQMKRIVFLELDLSF